MLNLRGVILIVCIFLIKVTSLFAQNENNLSDFTKEVLIQYTEKIYGPDDLLINGVKYQPKNSKVNGNPDFEWDNSKQTKLFIKGQVYLNIDLRYDISLDQLILKKVLANGYERHIILNASLIDSFCLGNFFFINVPEQKDNSVKFAYYEKINAGKDLLLKKYKKIIINIYDDVNPNGKLSSQKYTYYIYNHNGLTKVSSKKAFLNFYRRNRKEIGKFMRENGIVYKNANNEELIKLMNFCHAKSIQNN